MILDIWSMTHSHVDILLPKTSTKGFLSLLPSHLTEHEPIITNLRAAVDYTYPSERTVLPSLADLTSLVKTAQAREKAEDVHALADIFFTNYQSYETINQWLRLLESLRPELVELVSLGKSYEGREILGVKIKGNKEHVKPKTNSATPGMVLHGAQHAREWISVSTVCYIAYQLVSGYYVDEHIRRIVNEFEWRYFFCISR